MKRAYGLGEAVGKVAELIFSDRAVDGMRPVRALVHLAHRYTPQRLQAACTRALEYGTPCYQSVKEILSKCLDKPEEARAFRPYRFQRERGYFDPRNHTN